jgi:hypothetical protein
MEAQGATMTTITTKTIHAAAWYAIAAAWDAESARAAGFAIDFFACAAAAATRAAAAQAAAADAAMSAP